MFMEISKFMIKAKRILDKTWAIGYYFKIGNKDFIGVPISATNESNSDIEWNEIDPSTICRSTGVFDRTGEMLFENDNFIYYKINSSERYHSVACYNEKEGKWCCEDGRPLFSIINMDYELNVTQNMFDYPSKNEGSIDWTSLVETKPTDVVSIFECKTSSKEQPVYTVIRIKHEKDTGETILCAFIVNMKFDSLIYSQKIIDAIQKVEHVTDVHIDHEASVEQGIFIAQYNDNNELGPLTKIERKCYLASGYAKQSTQQDAESELPTFREAIVIKLETE